MRYSNKALGDVIRRWQFHYNDVIMGSKASQITSLTIVYSAVYSDADQRKHQSSASLAFVRGIHRGPVNSPRKWPVTRKMFSVDDIMRKSALYDSPTHMDSCEYNWELDQQCVLWCTGNIQKAHDTCTYSYYQAGDGGGTNGSVDYDEQWLWTNRLMGKAVCFLW